MKFDIMAALKDFGKGMARTDPNGSVTDRLSGGFGGMRKFGTYKKKPDIKPKTPIETVDITPTEVEIQSRTDDTDTPKRRRNIFKAMEY